MSIRGFADRWTRPEVARAVSTIVLGLVIGLALVGFATARRGMTGFGPALGADYAQFHAVGMLLDRYPASRLYDMDLQDALLHEAVPGLKADEHLPFAYPPFLAPAFRPLSRLPFARSFAAWMAISLGLYAGSIALMTRGDPGRSTAWLLALSFEPFALECWLGGQLSGLGCLAVAACLAFQRAVRPFAGGLALAGLLYKPTLLVLVVPLLVVGRRWRTIGGLVVGGSLLAGLSVAVAGPSGCLDFVDLMRSYGRRGGSVGDGFRTFKYVDLRAFWRLLGAGPGWSTGLAIAVGLPCLSALGAAWARARSHRAVDLAWAAALCWTPVLNLYGPVYDVSLAVPGLILAARALGTGPDGTLPGRFRHLLAVIYMSALISPAMARGVGIQPLTVALLAMGASLVAASLRAGNGGEDAFPR